MCPSPHVVGQLRKVGAALQDIPSLSLVIRACEEWFARQHMLDDHRKIILLLQKFPTPQRFQFLVELIWTIYKKCCITEVPLPVYTEGSIKNKHGDVGRLTMCFDSRNGF